MHQTWPTQSIQPSDMHTVGVHHVSQCHDISRHVSYGSFSANIESHRTLPVTYLVPCLNKSASAIKTGRWWQIILFSARQRIGTSCVIYFRHWKSLTDELNQTSHLLYPIYLTVLHPHTVVVLPKKNWVKLWLLLQSYRDIAWYVACPHITCRRSVVRLELHQRGVRVATGCSLDSQPQCMFHASFSEICYTVTFADPGHGVIILESKVTAIWMCSRNGRCHGNVYLCITN